MTKWSLAVLVCFPLLAGCGKPIVCVTEVTEGNGTFHASAQGRSIHQTAAERESRDAACESLCVATHPTDPRAACVSRCVVDGSMGKIGLRTACSEGTL